jgi:hypothetical protein
LHGVRTAIILPHIKNIVIKDITYCSGKRGPQAAI